MYTHTKKKKILVFFFVASMTRRKMKEEASWAPSQQETPLSFLLSVYFLHEQETVTIREIERKKKEKDTQEKLVMPKNTTNAPRTKKLFFCVCVFEIGYSYTHFAKSTGKRRKKRKKSNNRRLGSNDKSYSPSIKREIAAG